MNAPPGHFYLIGVGPGAPDLVTLRAARLIDACQVLVAPRSEKSEESLALAVVRDRLVAQQVIEHVYPMERDPARTAACWAALADRLAEDCAAGRAVAHLTIGDPLIYSTAVYLMAQMAERIPAERLHVVPGISAFQAAAAITVQPLTIQEDRLMLMPATSLDEVALALERCETLVLYKIGARLPALIDLLSRRGVLNQARLVCHVEQGEREVVLSDLRQLADTRIGYMATVIVRAGHRRWEPR
jgi:precorrin-2/cobalt-factor-2 C20-methyltransferase